MTHLTLFLSMLLQQILYTAFGCVLDLSSTTPIYYIEWESTSVLSVFTLQYQKMGNTQVRYKYLKTYMLMLLTHSTKAFL